MTIGSRLAGLLMGGALLCVALPASAQPWLDSGDAGLRHDIQLLADWGIVRRPVTTWPLSAPDIAADLFRTQRLEGLSAEKMLVVRRVRARLNEQADARRARGAAEVSVAGDRAPLRGFQDQPRAKAEIVAEVAGLMPQLSYRLRYTRAVEADDHKEDRLDGSFIATYLGNWMLGVGSVDRWWGPGNDGSLILSTNARPVPGVFVQRKESTPFQTRWLSWMGPWQLTAFMGRMEHERVVPNARLFGMRLNFRPTPNLEVGLSRTAQWAGEGRPSDFGTFVDLLAGKDNADGGANPADQPGNQLAGYDIRYVLNRFELPVAVYLQLIGEDEAGFFPSKYIGLLGLEGWSTVGAGATGLRWHLEYADTAANFFGDPLYNVAYEHSAYQSGYRYYGNSIGHSIDSDSRLYSAGLLLAPSSGRTYQLLLRRAELNRDGRVRGGGSTPVSADVWRVDGILTVPLSARESLNLGLGYSWIDGQNAPVDGDVPAGYINWRRVF